MQIWHSDHSFLRKWALMVESVYNALNLLFTWFSLANFYIFFVSYQGIHRFADLAQVILTSALEGSSFNIPHINILNNIAQVTP